MYFFATIKVYASQLLFYYYLLSVTSLSSLVSNWLMRGVYWGMFWYDKSVGTDDTVLRQLFYSTNNKLQFLNFTIRYDR